MTILTYEEGMRIDEYGLAVYQIYKIEENGAKVLFAESHNRQEISDIISNISSALN